MTSITNPITLKKTFASLPSTTRGRALVINGDPKGKNWLYCNGNNVFIRNIEDITECDIYAEHSKNTTVAKYSPSGFYIASADTSGKVRIWDTVNPEHIMKVEHAVIAGAIKDIDWTVDNQKLVAGGEGRENFSKALQWDTGTTCGVLSGHTKSVNAVSIKQSRPFRCATASEDYSSIFYENIPFKFKASKDDHTNFVNCVRYSPDDSKYVTAGADGKMFIYDGSTGELVQAMEAEKEKAHSGGIYAICFNKDGSKLLSVSADKTAKIWNMESKAVETVFKMGTDVRDMQVGCLWQGDNIMTVSLSGHINYLDPLNPGSPRRIIKGHNKPICGLAVSADGSKFYTAGSDGLIVSWNATTGEAEEFKGKGHTNQVSDLAVDGDYLVSLGIDDTVRFTNAAGLEYSENIVKMKSQPQAMDCHNGVCVVACLKELVVLQTPGSKQSEINISPEAKCVSIRQGGAQVAVGSATHMHIYEQSGCQLNATRSLPAEECCAVRYSPDGAYLAVSAKNSIMVYDVEDDFKELVGGWGKQHTATVKSISWSPDSRRFASGGIDTHLIVWTVGDFKGKKPTVKAHPLSTITSLKWLDNNSVITAGHDSNVKVWNVAE